MRLKFLGGGLVIKDPIGVEILEWCRDVNQNVFCGGGVGVEHGYFLEPYNSD